MKYLGFKSKKALAAAYIQAYEKRPSRYITASQVLADELDLYRYDVVEKLKELEIQLLGRDRLSSEETKAKVSAGLKKIHQQRSAEEQLQINKRVSKTKQKKTKVERASIVDKWRQAMGVKTEEELASIAAKRVKTLSDPEVKARQVAGIKDAIANRTTKQEALRIKRGLRTRANHSPEVKEATRQKHVEAQHSKSQEERASIVQKFRNTIGARSEEYQANVCENHRLAWERKNQKQRRAIFTKAIKTKIKNDTLCTPTGYYAIIDGQQIWFDSSWEEVVYRFLLEVDEVFSFHDEKTIVQLGNGVWHCDFLLTSIDCLLEVKGHYKAVESWLAYKTPAILKTPKLNRRVRIANYHVVQQLAAGRVSTVTEMLELCYSTTEFQQLFEAS